MLFSLLIYQAVCEQIYRSFLQLVWLCCIWVLWNERNSNPSIARQSEIIFLLVDEDIEY